MSPKSAPANIHKLMAQKNYPDAARECLAFLKTDPRHVEANLLYGELAILMNRPQDAIIIFRKLLGVVPNHPVAHDKLAYLYSFITDYANAKKHAEVALSIDKGAIESRLALGACALQEDNRDVALEMFNAARELAPGNINVERAYLDALLQVGEFEQAQELIRQLLEQHPDDAHLYNSMARTRKFAKGDPDIALIHSLVDDQDNLTRPDWHSSSQIAAWMALHKVESDIGNYDRAFAYLCRAMAIRKQQNPYQHEQVENTHKSLQSIFTAEFFARHGKKELGSADNSPIFVICMPRSGSTLLERVLGSSPQIAAAGELPLSGRLMQELCAKFGDNQHDLPGLNKVPDEVWAQAGDEYVRRARSRVGDAPFFIDKMPSNFTLLGFIRAMLPRARIINLTRHPVANCLSIYETDFANGHVYSTDQQWLGDYYVAYRQCMEYWCSIIGEDVFDLRYEDLVSNTEATVARLGEFLQVDLDPGAIRASQESGHILTASLWQARQPIHTKSIERWKQMEQHLQPLIAALAPVLPPENPDGSSIEDGKPA